MARKRKALVFAEVDREDAGADEAESEEERFDMDDAEGTPEVAADGEVAQAATAPDEIVIVEAKSKKRITVSLATQANIVCTVCGQKGHTAGFRGSVYVDCPVKPCFLCKQLGHTTATCPYRMDPTLNVRPAGGSELSNLAATLSERERSPSRKRMPAAPYRKRDWRIETACMKLHTRRVTCLEFVPRSSNLVVSCDKKGHVAIWNFEKVFERTVFDEVHKYQVNAMKFVPEGDGRQLLTASCDGTCQLLDIETGMHVALCDMNPGGWIDGVTTEKSWCMLQGITSHQQAPHVAYAGDSHGQIHCLDLRTKDVQWTVKAHGTHRKVTSLDMHPLASNLLLTASNDYTCKLFDVRTLPSARKLNGSTPGKGECKDLIALMHPRVVSAAYFSPITGNSILTTCQDNRLRVWDFGTGLDGPASREMVHSHDFNRHLTPFRAVWDPKDRRERVIMIGRYISEDFDGLAVHPIDVIDGSTGSLLEQMQDPNLELINPVNMPHPFLDVVVTGSSGHLFCWRPSDEDEGDESEPQPTANGNSNVEWELAPTGSGSILTGGASQRSRMLKGSSKYTFYDATAAEKKAKKSAAKKATETPSRKKK